MFCVLAAALLGACAGGPPPPPEGSPNVLLVSFDTTRRDHCSVYGYERPTTPVLEALAEQGARFDLAYAPTATTGPTHATLFTSLYPITHRVIKNGLPLAEDLDTLAERFRRRGYATAAVVASYVLDEKFGYAQGFQWYDDDFTPEGTTSTMDRWHGYRVAEGFDRRADDTVDRALGWLDERPRDRPFFLFLHFFDPHAPYVPPADSEARFPPLDDTELDRLRARYDAEIAFADREVGRLLDDLDRRGLARQTIVAMTADHGEGLMQRGHPEHGVHIYEEAVRVPMIVRWSGRIEPGRVVAEPVEMVDLAPTLLALSGAPVDDGLHGRNLARTLLRGAPLDPERPVYLHRRHYDGGKIGDIFVRGEKFGLRIGDWKYIEGREEQTRELFDLASDPGELVNLVDEHPERAARMAEQLQQWIDARVDPLAATGEISDEDLERLRALGYVQ